jgi:putative addiction module killer protein
MREHFGVGWRMYYIQYGKQVLLMLGGGSKSTQAADIKQVKRLLENLEK